MQVLRDIIIDRINSQGIDDEGHIYIYKHEHERKLFILKSGYLTTYANEIHPHDIGKDNIQIYYGITDDITMERNRQINECLFTIYSPYLITTSIDLNANQLNNFLYQIRTNKKIVEKFVSNPELRLKENEEEEDDYFINEDFSDPAQRQLLNDELSEHGYYDGKRSIKKRSKKRNIKRSKKRSKKRNIKRSKKN
jgi:hypothetical protein